MSPAPLLVIKYGGHALEDLAIRETFLADISRLIKENINVIIVHGGGPQINELLTALNIKSQFINGLRVTDERTLETVEMVLCGAVNKKIIRMLVSAGVNAAGISGEDGKLFIAEQKGPGLGRVGEIIKVNPELPQILLANGFIPVIAPLALDDYDKPLNINADTAAGALAGAMKADYFILISDVPGVLDKDQKLCKKLSQAQIDVMKEKGVISGGMIPKVGACLKALKCGCKVSLILDGRLPNAIKIFMDSVQSANACTNFGTIITG